MALSARREKYVSLQEEFYNKFNNEISRTQQIKDDAVKEIIAEFDQFEKDLLNLRRDLLRTDSNIHEADQEKRQLQNELSKMNIAQTKSNESLMDQTQTNKLLEDETAIKENELTALTEELNKKREEADEKTLRLKDSVEMYAKHMGLEIHVLKEKRMQFLFKNLTDDESDDDQVAYVIIKMKDHHYEVLESFPEITSLKTMETTLNNTNNLSGFIQLCRKEFQKMLSGSPDT